MLFQKLFDVGRDVHCLMRLLCLWFQLFWLLQLFWLFCRCALQLWQRLDAPQQESEKRDFDGLHDKADGDVVANKPIEDNQQKDDDDQQMA